MKIEYQPIGIIHTPFTELQNIPIQPKYAGGIEGKVEIFPQYAEGLQDLSGFSHIILLFHLHRSEGYKLKVIPYLDDHSRGVFATHAPKRPNPIGLSIVKLKRIEGNILHIENPDMLDGTPLLNIKPYILEFQDDAKVKSGWVEEVKIKSEKTRSDNRFV